MTEASVPHPVLYLSYSQFMVFDRDVRDIGSDWTDEHVGQGFARRESTVSFSTLDEFGNAEVTASISRYVPADHHDRVIAVPFLVASGVVVVEGPEEIGTGRTVALQPGHYRLVCAQTLRDEGDELIDLYFERLAQPLLRSEILVCDEGLDPPAQLIETAEITGL